MHQSLLKNTHGLWNALEVADLDGDGDLDVLPPIMERILSIPIDPN